MSQDVSVADVRQFEPMVEKMLRTVVCKNWSREVQPNYVSGQQNHSLGNTAMTMDDFKGELMIELVVGLKKYKINTGATKSTFIYKHLRNRALDLTRKYIKSKKRGYEKVHYSFDGLFCSQHKQSQRHFEEHNG